MDKKTRPAYMLPTTDPLRTNDLHRVKVKDWKKIFQANGQKKKSGVAIRISEKNRLQNKGHKKTCRMTLQNTQGMN